MRHALIFHVLFDACDKLQPFQGLLVWLSDGSLSRTDASYFFNSKSQAMTLTAIMAAAPVQRIKLEPIGNSAPASIGPIPAPRSLHTVQAAKASTRAGPGFCMATIGDTIGITSERKITTATALIQSHSNPIPNMAMAAANDSPSN